MGVMDDPAFSRSGETSPLGKATEELKTLVAESVKEHFCAVAVMHGKTASEYLRDVVMGHLYGEFQLARMKVSGRATVGERQE